MARFANNAVYTLADPTSYTVVTGGREYTVTLDANKTPATVALKTHLWIEQTGTQNSMSALGVFTLVSGSTYTLKILKREILEGSNGVGEWPTFTASASKITSSIDAMLAGNMTPFIEGPCPIIFGIGQSNMLPNIGFDTGKAYEDEANVHELMWNYNPQLNSYLTLPGYANGVVGRETGQTLYPVRTVQRYNGSTFMTSNMNGAGNIPTNTRSTGILGGFALSYIQSDYNLGKRVILLNMARGNTGCWENGGEWGLYTNGTPGEILADALAAVNYLIDTGYGYVAAILDMQGEKDADTGYAPSFQVNKTNEINYIRGPNGIHTSQYQPNVGQIPCIMGKVIADAAYKYAERTAVNTAMQAIVDDVAVSNVALADYQDNTAITYAPDYTHFYSDGVLLYGRELFFNAYDTLLNSVVPDDVTGFTVTANPLRLDYAWNQEQSGYPNSTYTIEWSATGANLQAASGTSGWTVVASSIANGTLVYSDTGLTSGETRYSRIVATNASGASNYVASTPASAVVGAAATPDTITVASIADSGNKQVAVTLNVPANSADTGTLTYQVQYSSDSTDGIDGTWSDIYDAGEGTATSTDTVVQCLFDGSTNNGPDVQGTYWFKGRAINQDAVAGTYGAGTTYDVPVGSATLTAIDVATEQQAILTITDTGTGAAKYEVQYSTDDTIWNDGYDAVEGARYSTNTSFGVIFDGALNGTDPDNPAALAIDTLHYFRVRALDASDVPLTSFSTSISGTVQASPVVASDQRFKVRWGVEAANGTYSNMLTAGSPGVVGGDIDTWVKAGGTVANDPAKEGLYVPKIKNLGTVTGAGAIGVASFGETFNDFLKLVGQTSDFQVPYTMIVQYAPSPASPSTPLSDRVGGPGVFATGNANARDAITAGVLQNDVYTPSSTFDTVNVANGSSGLGLQWAAFTVDALFNTTIYYGLNNTASIGTPATGVGYTTTNTPTWCYIGAHNGGGNFLKGSILALDWFPRILTITEIEALVSAEYLASLP